MLPPAAVGKQSILRGRSVYRDDSGIQLIPLCGKNEALADQLRAMNPRIPMFVQGFTRDVPLYGEIADFFIGKRRRPKETQGE